MPVKHVDHQMFELSKGITSNHVSRSTNKIHVYLRQEKAKFDHQLVTYMLK